MTNLFAGQTLLRHRDGHHAHVTNEELFFDLVYAFAVTQLSHALLHHLTLTGVAETLILWFAVWLGWQYTCWVTNWFEPETPRIRGLLFALMLAALIMAAVVPGAFGEGGPIFVLAYVAIQVGRTGYIVWELGRDHPHAADPAHARLALYRGGLLDQRRFCRTHEPSRPLGDRRRLRICLTDVWRRPAGAGQVADPRIYY